MKLYYVFVFLFVILAHIQELQTILKDIEKMHLQIQQLNDNIKELKNQPEHIKEYVEMANEIKP